LAHRPQRGHTGKVFQKKGRKEKKERKRGGKGFAGYRSLTILCSPSPEMVQRGKEEKKKGRKEEKIRKRAPRCWATSPPINISSHRVEVGPKKKKKKGKETPSEAWALLPSLRFALFDRGRRAGEGALKKGRKKRKRGRPRP